MSTGYRSLPRPRYSRARRAAIVAACASVLTGTAMAMPAATFADEAADTPPIATVDLGGSTVSVPGLGVPLPDVELDTTQLPLTTVTDALGVQVALDTAPEAADTAPTTTEPTTAEPTTAEPGAQPGWGVPDDEVTTKSDPAAIEPDGSADRRGLTTPSAVAAPAPGSRLNTASPAAQQAATGVLEARTQRQIEQRAAIRAAQVLGTEKTAPAVTPSKAGLATPVPLTDLASRGGVDTLNLASRNGPDSATGDWNLLPEVLYAVIPLMLAGAAVIAHGRRNARVAATSVGVVQRRRHANPK